MSSRPVASPSALLSDPAWVSLMSLMAVLAEEHGAENVRLVVWFDS